MVFILASFVLFIQIFSAAVKTLSSNNEKRLFYTFFDDESRTQYHILAFKNVEIKSRKNNHNYCPSCTLKFCLKLKIITILFAQKTAYLYSLLMSNRRTSLKIQKKMNYLLPCIIQQRQQQRRISCMQIVEKVFFSVFVLYGVFVMLSLGFTFQHNSGLIPYFGPESNSSPGKQPHW